MLCCAWPCGFQAANDLLLEAELIQTRYCAEANGVISVRPKLQLRYRNTSGVPIILPLFSVLSSWQMFEKLTDTDSDRPELMQASKPDQILDTSRLDRTKPNPLLFRTIEPQATFEIPEEVRIAVRPKGQDQRLLGKDHYLRVEINTWPDPANSSKGLQQVWKAYGRLLAGRFLSEPVKIHIDHSPAAKHCPDRID
jgi:hypothetical protein